PPIGGCCVPPVGDPWDCNADGVFNVQDYACDPRVSDTNGSGALDRGDLRVFVDHLDNDGNGYVDDLSGWDADDDDGDEFDHRYFGHGTGRAGIVAPETNNGRGVAGVCPNCPLMNVRIDDTFVCESEGVAKGAIYAVEAPSDVPGADMGISGGNPNDASYGATEGGTSSSTPHAAGVAALVFSRARDLIAASVLPVAPLALKDISAQEVRQIINQTADDITPADGTGYAVSVGWDKWPGYGRINANRRVDRVAPNTIPP